MMAGILNLTEQPLPSSLQWLPPGAPPPVGMLAGVWVRNLYTESAAGTLADIEAGITARCLLAWIALMQGGDEEGIIQQWKRLVEQEEDRSLRATYAGLALVFAEKRQRGEVWRRALEGWDVQESPIVKQWQQKALERGVAAMRQSVVRVLQVQSKEALPSDILEAIDKQNDLDELVAWHDLALQAVSPDAFRAAIRQRNGAAAP
jgi:hypothetical protein